MNAKTISSDKPVKDKSEDRFQRYEFSKRIADSIIKSKSNDSVVYGIYGAWGEGKTSILNFIINELSTNTDIIPIRFNPWRFTEEATLLVTFFNALARVVKESFKTLSTDTNRKQNIINRFKNKWNSKKEPLQTDGEIIGELLKKYGKIVSIFGAGEAAEALGNSLANVDIETLKERFEKLLISSHKKLVIFIDDIDRLDKQEIHSIFRLVKLTADFSNTIYILSFDQEMVASAIGERYGEGSKESGRNFLEKIIQVPLKIPQAQPKDLKTLCYELVDRALEESELDLPVEDAQRFTSAFSDYLLPRLKTPRLAIRYGNSLQFSIPLLKGEVNHVDLMLIEAVRIFFPDHYEFIKKYPGYFTSSYSTINTFGHTNEIDSKKKELFEHLNNLSKDFTPREKNSIKYLLIELFPSLNEAFNNTYSQNIRTKMYNKRSIGSPDYFNRYFTYCVLKGEISDVSFDLFLNSIVNGNPDKSTEELRMLISQSSIDNFLYKIRNLEDDLGWEISQKLIPVLSQLGNIFPKITLGFRLGSEEPMSQAAIFIYQLLKRHGNPEENLIIAKELMQSSQPFEFAYEINNWLRIGDKEEDKLFRVDQYISLAEILRDRAFAEADDIPLFKKFPNSSPYILITWKEADPVAFKGYICQILDSEPKLVLDLLITFTPTMRSSSEPEPYKASFSKQQYEFFKKTFDVDYIHNLILNQYSDELQKEEVKFSDYEDVQSNINILRQFEHWYKIENEVL